MPDATSPLLNIIPRSWDHARRDELTAILDQIDAMQRRFQSDDPTFDPLSQARDNLSDAASDIKAEIDRLTEEIGDGRAAIANAQPQKTDHG